MSHDPNLDNSYRQVNDRIIPERQYQYEQAAEALFDLFPVHPLLQLVVGSLSAIAMAVYVIQLSSGPWNEVYVLLGIFWVLVAGVLGALLSMVVLYGGAGYLAYRSTGSFTVAFIAPMALAYIVHKWGGIAFALRLTRIDGTRAMIGRPVRIFIVMVFGALAAIVIAVVLVDRKHELEPPAQTQALIAEQEPETAVLVNAPGAVNDAGHPQRETQFVATSIGVDLTQATITKLEAAVSAGVVGAETELGVRYLNGAGVAKNYTAAIAHFQTAASKGDTRAITNLGWMMTLGQGIARDDAKALDQFNEAASKGYANAQDSLGYMYEHGRGVSRDLSVAESWYRKAADQGFKKSKSNLQRLAAQQ